MTIRESTLSLATLTLWLSVATTAVQAVVVSVGSGYEISYSIDLKAGTLHGSDVTNVFILETDGAQVNIEGGFIVPHQGPFTLTHEIPFAPTDALILGLDLAPSGSGLKDHLVVFMDNDFAADALTRDKFSDIFLPIDGRQRVRHSTLVQAVKDAQSGDSGATTLLSEFFTLDAGKLATFNPEGSFRVIEFSQPVAIDVPDTGGTLVLFSGTLLALAGMHRRWRR